MTKMKEDLQRREYFEELFIAIANKLEIPRHHIDITMNIYLTTEPIDEIAKKYQVTPEYVEKVMSDVLDLFVNRLESYQALSKQVLQQNHELKRQRSKVLELKNQFNRLIIKRKRKPYSIKEILKKDQEPKIRVRQLISLNDVQMSVKTRNALVVAGLKYLQDIKQPYLQFLDQQGIVGVKVFEEVKTIMNKYEFVDRFNY